MFIDTHVHFDGLTEPDRAIERAMAAGVEKIVAVGGSQSGNEMAVELAGKYPDKIIAAAGFDREHAGKQIDFTRLETYAHEKSISAIGEIGLDYHYHPETAAAQKILFGQILEIARNFVLPVIVHSRNADDDTIELLKEHVALWKGNPDQIGVLHCFTGDSAFAHKVLDLGLYLSFSGIITFAKAVQLRETAKMVPDDRLLIETDSPYLAPEPYRGKKNEPAYVKYVAEALAKERNCSVEKIADITTANADRLFCS
ncbi:MAG: TatD family hydrolase [Kiritimatiellae bacterium]|nr:TatD family hydrolase [Kiritimatiellia bacterium]MDD5520438.1 TatD family hydrolase [Kiritimatiellia bacterium]